MQFSEILDLCIMYDINFVRIKPKCIINLQLHNREVYYTKHRDSATRNSETSHN